MRSHEVCDIDCKCPQIRINNSLVTHKTCLECGVSLVQPVFTSKAD